MPAPVQSPIPALRPQQVADASGDPEDLEPVLALETAVLLLVGVAAGAIVSAVVLPALVPNLATSVVGDQPKAFWYLSRSSGVVAYLLLWFSMVLGLMLTNRFARLWAGGPAVADIHQFSSLLSLAFVTFHVLILLGDRYAKYRLDQLLVPFTSAQYEPFWVGLGQMALYVALPVSFTFYLRRRIGVHAWRTIHYASFGVFVLAVAHGLGAGTDTRTPALLTMYLVTTGTVFFLTMYRVLTARGRRLYVRPSTAH